MRAIESALPGVTVSEREDLRIIGASILRFLGQIFNKLDRRFPHGARSLDSYWQSIQPTTLFLARMKL